MKKTLDVVCAVIIKDNLCFCCQRGNYGTLAYKWEFPGGKIEQSEDPVDAIKREIFEELESEIEVERHLITVHHDYPTFNIVLHAYQCILVSGELKLSEHVASKWVKKTELHLLDFADADRPIIDFVTKLN